MVCTVMAGAILFIMGLARSPIAGIIHAFTLLVVILAEKRARLFARPQMTKGKASL